MDGDRFDDLSRKLATAVSRRHAVKGAVAGLLGAFGLRKAADAQASCGNVVCYNWRTQTVDVACASGCVCCIYANGNSRCTPPGSCLGTVATTTTTAAPTTTTAAPTTTTTTAAPTTTTTTAAPTTTTTTTTSTTTSTTTTTVPPSNPDTFCAGADACLGSDPCNQPGCSCATTVGGGGVCRFTVDECTGGVGCNSDAQCGLNQFCIVVDNCCPVTGFAGICSTRCAPATTTAAPTTTTTTTTAAPTTTTTTTTPPSQGTCAAGQDTCVSTLDFCNGIRCLCFTTTSGATICADGIQCTSCDDDADCTAVTGSGSFCIDASGANCACGGTGTACAVPCPNGA